LLTLHHFLIQTFLSYQYTKYSNDAKFVNLIRNIYLVEGNLFWSDYQKKLVKAWIDYDKEKVESFDIPVTLNFLLNFGDIRYVRNKINTVILGLKNDLVLDEILSFISNKIENRLDKLQYVLHLKEKRCPLIKIAIKEAKSEEEKSEYLKIQEINCGNCQEVRDDIEQILFFIKEQEVFLKLLKPIFKNPMDKILLNQEDLYKVNYSVLAIEILHNWNNDEYSSFAQYILKNALTPLISNLDFNSIHQFAKINETLQIGDTEKREMKRYGV
jgi:hypothetical protein